MKKLLFFSLFIVLSISVYYDFTEGTLFNQSNTSSSPSSAVTVENLAKPSSSASSNVLDGQETAEVTVERGQTVLTIVEKLHNGPVPASIQQISNDFKELNNGLSPENIQADKSYVFPLYNTTQ